MNKKIAFLLAAFLFALGEAPAWAVLSTNAPPGFFIVLRDIRQDPAEVVGVFNMVDLQYPWKLGYTIFLNKGGAPVDHRMFLRANVDKPVHVLLDVDGVAAEIRPHSEKDK